jgi:prophage regulatory protein
MQKLIRLKQVMASTGLSRSYVYTLSNNGTFPKSIQLTERSVAWVEAEVNDWITERIINSRN